MQYSHINYDVIRNGKKIKLAPNETLNIGEYYALLHRNSQEYIRINMNYFGLLISDLASQRLLYDVTSRGFSVVEKSGLLILYYHEFVMGTYVKFEIKAYLALHVKNDFQTFFSYMDSARIENLTGTIEEFDRVFCLIALNHLLPEKENHLFTLV